MGNIMINPDLIGQAVMRAYTNGYPEGDPRNGDHNLALADETAHELSAQYVEDERSTQELYEHDPTAPGTYTVLRTEMHEDIIEKFVADNVDVPNDRHAVIMGGIFGAGKGYAQEVLGEGVIGFDPDDYATVNPDDIKVQLMANDPNDYQGLTPGETSGLFHEESSDLSKDQMQLAVAEGKNVILDYSMSSVSSLDQRIELLHGAGYDVRMVFVDTAPMDAAANSVVRWTGPDGRWVDLDLYDQVQAQVDADPRGWTPNRAAFEARTDAVESWMLIQGSAHGGPAPSVVKHS
jgi:hypothetical protein